MMSLFVNCVTASAALAIATMPIVATAQDTSSQPSVTIPSSERSPTIEPTPPPADGPVLSTTFDFSVLNDYITPHGLVATTRGISAQAVGSASLAFATGVSITGGVWTDFNPGYDKIGNTTKDVNETDPFLAISYNATKRLSLTAKYIPFIGNNLPKTAHNIAFIASYADGAPGQKLTINPYAVFFYEAAGSSVIGVGKAGNTFDVWLGITPTLKLDGLIVAAPTFLTLGPKSFYGQIDDGILGQITTGLKVIKPLDLGPKAGKWAVYATAQYYYLANDNLVLVKSLINRGDHKSSQLQFGVGFNVGF